MAIYHLSVKTISRSAGRSATGAIAYRSGEKIACERTGLVHDYSRKTGVEHTEIFTPKDSPEWAQNRAELWNAAEKAENRKNSTVAREFEVALPSELSQKQRVELVREFAKELVQRHGMAVDVAIHTPGKEGDHRNHHAHILCSTRRLTPEGFKDKTRELDTKNSGEVVHWRERWAQISNRHLEQAGRSERIDHRTLEAQKVEAIERGDSEQATQLERKPTIHLGPNVVQMEKRGIQTDRGDQLREIVQHNAHIIDLAEVRERIQAERETQQNIVDVHTDSSGKNSYQETRNLIQRELNAELLKQWLIDREPEKTAHELKPETIKREWQKEKDHQFTLVSDRAKSIHTKVSTQVKRQDAKLRAHDQLRPQEPRGLFSGFKQAAHEQAVSVWRNVRRGLERRWTQLQKRLKLVGEYMRKAGPYESPTRGELLAEKKAAELRPELATDFQKIVEKEKADRIAAYREKIEQNKLKQKDRHMTKRSDDVSKDREKTGQSKEDKKREMLERFKEKVKRDRDHDRSR